MEEPELAKFNLSHDGWIGPYCGSQLWELTVVFDLIGLEDPEPPPSRSLVNRHIVDSIENT